MRGVWRLGTDSIVVSDAGNGRLAVFDLRGKFGRTVRMSPAPDANRPVPAGVFGDASLFSTAMVRLQQGESLEGTRRDQILYLRHNHDGKLLNELVIRPGRERLTSMLDDGIVAVIIAPYGPSPYVVATGDRWYYGNGERYEIERYAMDGTLTHLYRRAKANRPITPEIAEEYRDRLAESEMPAAFIRLRRSMRLPETMPAFRRIVASDNGNLWVENYTLPEEQPSWAVFRDDGRYLGDVDTPMSARVLHIGDDFVLVSWEDELEVEYVQMYELIIP